MHQSSLENMQKCYERYIKTRNWEGRDKIEVIDIGGTNINGSYADVFSGSEFVYRSIDQSQCENVDIILEDPYKLPFNNESIDIIVSGQTFEHVEFFWLLFEEMVRVLDKDGVIILIAPSAGHIHQFPVDCYRFYPDAYRALAKYTKCEVLEIIHDQRGPWNDLVGVFVKDPLFFKEKDPPGRTWKANRFEQSTLPVNEVTRHPDQDVEKKAGEIAYLEVLEKLHKEIRPEQYLEIGLWKGLSLSLAGPGAIAIDPVSKIGDALMRQHQVYQETSDQFFEFHARDVLGEKKIDFAFIDGMHLFEFVLRDFINIEMFSAPHAVVVIDDIFPNHKIQAQRKRESANWMGDIWKIAYCLSEFRKDLQLSLLDTKPSGLLVITGLKSENKELLKRYNSIVHKYKNMELECDFHKEVINRKSSVSPDDQDFWKAIKCFVRKMKSAAPGERKKILARQKKLIAELRRK